MVAAPSPPTIGNYLLASALWGDSLNNLVDCMVAEYEY